MPTLFGQSQWHIWHWCGLEHLHRQGDILQEDNHIITMVEHPRRKGKWWLWGQINVSIDYIYWVIKMWLRWRQQPCMGLPSWSNDPFRICPTSNRMSVVHWSMTHVEYILRIGQYWTCILYHYRSRTTIIQTATSWTFYESAGPGCTKLLCSLTPDFC